MRFQHGFMQGVCGEMRVPHRNRQRKTKQTQNTILFINRLVEILKRKPSHKERKQKLSTLLVMNNGSSGYLLRQRQFRVFSAFVFL
jgi:hypothetical protein